MTRKQPEPITLDPAAPMRSMREAAGLTQTALAAARGVAQPSQSGIETSGDAVTLRVLRETAALLGGRIEVRFVPAEQDSEQKKGRKR